MKNQALRNILCTCTALLFFSIVGCTGEWSGLSEDASSGAGPCAGRSVGSTAENAADYFAFPAGDLSTANNSDSGGYIFSSADDSVPGTYPYPDWQCMAGPCTSNNNNPGPSGGGHRTAEAMDGLYLSSANLLIDDGTAWSGYYDCTEYGLAANQHMHMGEYTTQYEAHADPFDLARNMPSALQHSEGTADGAIDRTNDTTLDSIVLDANSSIYDAAQPIHMWIDQYFPPAQPTIEEPSPSITPASAKKSAGTARRTEKRKVEQTDGALSAPVLKHVPNKKRKKSGTSLKLAKASSSCQQQEKESGAEDMIELAQNSQVVRSREASSTEERVSIGISLWNSRRLENVRRRKYKSNNKVLYSYRLSEGSVRNKVKIKTYQTQLRKEIAEYSSGTAQEIEQNALWYFIASRSTTLSTKYRDLLGLQELFKSEGADECKRIVEGMKGYYPHVFIEMAGYLEKHRPMKGGTKGSSAECSETLGDIYIREDLELNHYSIREDKWGDQANRKYCALACAVRMILVLPEVYKDFSNISVEFIEETVLLEDSVSDSQLCEVLLRVQELVLMHREEKMDGGAYTNLYRALENIHGKEVLQKAGAAELYRKMYTLLAMFYEKAETDDRGIKYTLVGKGVVRSQKYMKCRVVVEMAPESSGKKVLSTEYAYEEDRWTVSSPAQAHYHVHYVDNTTGHHRVLCMPMYVDQSGKEQCLHTISEIVEYIKTLYKIEKRSEVIHPFKVDKQSRTWSYIKEKKERSKTVKELEEYEVVFYHIEEDVNMPELTFAQFRPLHPRSEYSIYIPLFLTPLMRSALELGPFTAVGEHKRLESVEFENREPAVYRYNQEYRGAEYSDVHRYYSNLCILPEEVESAECYSMHCQTGRKSGCTVEAVWYVRVLGSVDEYTHCVPDGAFREKESLQTFRKFIAVLESRNYNKDSELQGFWLGNGKAAGSRTDSLMHKINIWLPHRESEESMAEKSVEYLMLEIERAEGKLKETEDRRKSLGALSKYRDTAETRQRKKTVNSLKNRKRKKVEVLHQALYVKQARRPTHAETELIVYRSVNSSKSNLGAHNEILDVFISLYKQREKW
ncbi:hypothetical protein NEMIN01_2252 [Nematocida minor]|uniref:uncharacterized protein n=1 Tax=Nematocida minor TaxID=1912983 RepID=UPI00221EB7C3|nr:uncharacterized protein NEMIN01_2252 [Nematocida minor]KAI5192866.1 hypothetical protein NEMIN01_2252 [Nematocida minor]